MAQEKITSVLVVEPDGTTGGAKMQPWQIRLLSTLGPRTTFESRKHGKSATGAQIVSDILQEKGNG